MEICKKRQTLEAKEDHIPMSEGEILPVVLSIKISIWTTVFSENTEPPFGKEPKLIPNINKPYAATSLLHLGIIF